jgi:two-component system phosphate regulon response regulator PhoB
MSPASTVLLLEDEVASGELLQQYLGLKGLPVVLFANGSAALDWLRTSGEQLGAAVLDVMVPGADGYQVLAAIRQQPHTRNIPVLFLTAKDQEADEIRGLQKGADDYITKPASLELDFTRLQNLMRRTQPDGRTEAVLLGDLRLTPASQQCWVAGQLVDLTTMEFRLLHLFLSHPERVFSRHDLLEILVPADRAVFDRTIDAHIKNLRLKLGEDAAQAVRTVRGVGYGLNPAYGRE